jgi:hypothetical protein
VHQGAAILTLVSEQVFVPYLQHLDALDIPPVLECKRASVYTIPPARRSLLSMHDSRLELVPVHQGYWGSKGWSGY